MTQNKFDCTKDTVIDASAGTGKTYTITHDIVPQLLENEDLDLKLGQILIATYMDKAAGELRSRIRKELNNKLAELKNATDEKTRAFKNKIEEEIEHVDDAPIFTFHSFCQNILMENAIYSNCSQNMTLIDEEAALRTFIGKNIRDKFAHDDVFMRLYKTKDDIAAFERAITDATEKYYLDAGNNEDPDVIKLEIITPEEDAECVALLKKDAAPDETEIGKLRRWFILKNLRELYTAWQAEKATRNLQTYGDMIRMVVAALTAPNSKLLQTLRKKYKYAIIDEFQDTNKLEWTIFKLIFTGDDEHHITIVGDPKQSICSFQGADANIYNIAKDYITNIRGGNVWDLDINYRSSAPMIEAANLLTKELNLFPSYRDSVAPGADAPQMLPPLLDGKSIHPVHLIKSDKDSTATEPDVIVSKIIEFCTRVNPADKNSKTKLQIWHKDKDKTKCKYRDVTFGDFTVLVRKRAQADKLISAMKRAKIPFMWHKDTSLFGGKEVADWIALLTAIHAQDFNSDNRKILSGALQTAFFDIPIDKINADKYDDILCPERQMLLNWHNLAETKQYAKLLNAIFEDSKIADRFASYDKIQALAKYNQIGDFVLDSMLSKHASLANIVTTLKRRQKVGKQDADSKCVEKPTDKNMVKISTIHSAKGLEFPITIYLYVGQSKNSPLDNTIVQVEHTKNSAGANETHLRIKPYIVKKPSDFNALQYVAFTRASSLMFITNGSKLYLDAAKKYPDFFIKEPMTKTYTSATTILQDACPVDTAETVPGTIAMSAKKMYKHSYTSLSHPGADANTDVDDIITDASRRIDREDYFDADNQSSTRKYDSDCGVEIRDGVYNKNKIMDVNATATGAKYGTIVHEIFERIDFQFFETHDDDEAPDHLDPIIEKCFKRHAVNYDIAEVRSFITNTMGARFPEIIGNHATGKKFSLSSLAETDKKSEIEFDLNTVPGTLQNYCNGFIDLLFMREINGVKVYSILDWKTDLLPREEYYADYDRLKSRTDDKYAIQRVLYSYCLIQWLKQFYQDMTPAQIFDKHFGGIYYVYTRGCHTGTGNGIYAHTWANYERLETAFDNIMKIIKGCYHG